MRLVTHDGTFHADDVLAYTVLALAFPGAALVRTRDPAVIGEDVPSVVFDVGGRFSPSERMYDHHMRDKPRREDGGAYSSIGMVWAAHGIEALLELGCAPDEAGGLWGKVDRGLVSHVDRVDNGEATPAPGDFATLVDAYNPAWDEPGDRSDEAFLEAHGFARGVLVGEVRRAHASLRAEASVTRAAESAADPRVVVLERGMPWEGVLTSGAHPEALYVVYPRESEGTWFVTAVPPERGSFERKLPLPEAWGGLRDGELAAASGFPDAVFCHPALFICGARSRATALGMAAEAMRIGLADGPPRP